MANKTLFQSLIGKLLPRTNAVNEEHAPAYRFPSKHMLAQYAATGCMNATFYASADEQLKTVLELCGQIEPEFIARTALYARTRGHMKDLPALLCAVLAVRSPGLLAEVFDRVIDDGKMLRNFVQVVRSGVVGRKSLGTLPKRLISPGGSACAAGRSAAPSVPRPEMRRRRPPGTAFLHRKSRSG